MNIGKALVTYSKILVGFGIDFKFFTLATTDSGKLSLFMINHLLRESKFKNLLGRIQYKPIDRFHFTPFWERDTLNEFENFSLSSAESDFEIAIA